MLVLSRLRDETIVIGNDISITVVDIRGDKVRLGVTAPKTTSIHRQEIYDRIDREGHSAPPPAPPPTALEELFAILAPVAGIACELLEGDLPHDQLIRLRRILGVHRGAAAAGGAR